VNEQEWKIKQQQIIQEEFEMDLIMILGLAIAGIVLVIVVAGVAMGVLFCGDIMSYTGPGSKILSPAGTSVGKALVVFNPGLSGEARKAAEKIAGDLQSKGYTVNLAGIKSADATSISGYGVIVAGGPMYWGRVCNSVDSYLNALKPQNGVRLGVFGTTGSPQFHEGDIASFGKQVAACSCSSALNKMPVMKTIRSGEFVNTDCSDFVAAML
jgi:flavodoxin